MVVCGSCLVGERAHWEEVGVLLPLTGLCVPGSVASRDSRTGPLSPMIEMIDPNDRDLRICRLTPRPP